MKKIIMPAIILLAVVMMAIAASGKVSRRSLSIFQSSVPETETIAPETMEFVYDYAWCNDTTGVLDDNYTSDRMLLQVAANGLSKFSSFKNLTVDSLLMKANQEQIVDLVVEGKLANGEFMTIFKNYPDGKVTHTEKICMDWFRYEEDKPLLDWELTDSVACILGYECRGAVCSLRGRRWTAFYCEDIPVMDGPWKLCGLPGLIMKASDDAGHYKFECVGIRSNADRPITIYKVPYNKTDRRKYYDAKNRYDINPYAYYEAGGNGSLTITDENGNPVPDAYDPIDLPFDYIERDWKK